MYNSYMIQVVSGEHEGNAISSNSPVLLIKLMIERGYHLANCVLQINYNEGKDYVVPDTVTQELFMELYNSRKYPVGVAK